MILCDHELSSELTFTVGAKDPSQGRSVLYICLCPPRLTTQKPNVSIPFSGISGLPGALPLGGKHNKISFKEIMLCLQPNLPLHQIMESEISRILACLGSTEVVSALFGLEVELLGA